MSSAPLRERLSGLYLRGKEAASVFGSAGGSSVTDLSLFTDAFFQGLRDGEAEIEGAEASGDWGFQAGPADPEHRADQADTGRGSSDSADFLTEASYVTVRFVQQFLEKHAPKKNARGSPGRSSAPHAKPKAKH